MTDGANHSGCPDSPPAKQGKSTVRQSALSILLVLSVAAFAYVVGIASPYFAFTASLCLLGLFDLLRPLVRIRLPKAIRRVHPGEARTALYRVMGVPAFGALLRKTPLRMLNRRVYLEGGPKDLPKILMQIEDAEAAHFWSGLATTPYLLLAWSRGWWDSFVVVAVFNVVANLYPILHLRSVRTRLERAAHRRS
jgi:hypothetical protein